MPVSSLILQPFKSGRGSRGRDVARPAIAALLGVDESLVRFAEGPMGKPELLGFPGVHVALSHSAALIAIYVGPTEAGLDIELIRPRPALQDLAFVAMPAGEARLVVEGGEPGLERFYFAWTSLEARAKRVGLSVWDAFSLGDDDGAVNKDWSVSFLERRYALSLRAGSAPVRMVTMDDRIDVLPRTSVPADDKIE